MNKLTQLFLILFALSGFVTASTVLAAGDSVGSLRNVTGIATITRVDDSGKRKFIRAANGLPIYQKDLIKTTNGNLGIIFKDNTRISLARNSVLVINKYVYTPAKKQYGMITRVMKGKAAVFTGQISNLAADNVVFETPNATIRSKGTTFLIEVADTGEDV